MIKFNSNYVNVVFFKKSIKFITANLMNIEFNFLLNLAFAKLLIFHFYDLTCKIRNTLQRFLFLIKKCNSKSSKNHIFNFCYHLVFKNVIEFSFCNITEYRSQITL
jgi:hypothetical protein